LPTASVSKSNVGQDHGRARLLSWDEVAAITQDLPEDSVAGRLVQALRASAAAGQLSDELRDSKCLLLRYRYGERIVRNGAFQLPAGVDASSLVAAFKKRSVPLALLLDAPIEVFYDEEPDEYRGHTVYRGYKLPRGEKSHHHPRPSRVFQRGEMIGLFQLVEAMIDQPPQVAAYSLAAGEVSVYVGMPLTSREAGKTLAQFKAKLSKSARALEWRYWHPYERLFQELIPEGSWACSIVVLPDSLCEAVRNIPTVQNHLLLTYAKQIHQTQVELGEQGLVRSLAKSHAMEYSEQISYLLGIARGNVPALVPWHRAKPKLPVDPIVSHLWDHSLRRLPNPYYPFVMVPRHLQVGELGYVSCRWNTGPVAPALDAPAYTFELYEILSAYFRELFADRLDRHIADVFVPFVHADNLGDDHRPFLDRECKPLDESDFIMEASSSGKPAPRKAARPQQVYPEKSSMPDQGSRLWLRRGFLNAGFMIRRVPWL
jgi:hypothetical protein